MDKEKLAYDLALIYAKEGFRYNLGLKNPSGGAKNKPEDLLKLFTMAYDYYSKSDIADSGT